MSLAEKSRRHRRIIHMLPGAIREADKGKPDELCDLLLQLIPDDEGELLAELIKRKMTAGRLKGRPAGLPRTPDRAIEQFVVAIVRSWKKIAKGRLPNGTEDKWIDQILSQLAEDGELENISTSIKKRFPGGVSRSNIKSALKRAPKKKVPKVANNS